MAFTQYNTAELGGSVKSGGNGLLIGLLVLGAIGFGVYKFWWVPKKEKEKLAAAKK